MKDKSLQDTNKLLKVIIGLLIRYQIDKTPSLREQINILSVSGLAPSDIAEILGRSGNHVNKELSELRKAIKNKGSK